MKKEFLHINIMAHPDRKDWVKYLQKRIGFEVPVIWENGGGIWDTRRRCLVDHIAAGAEWSLTLQDDCLLTDNFVEKAIAFLKAHDKRGHRLFSANFYFWSQSFGLAQSAKRQGHYRSAGMKSGLAICLKAEIISPLLHYWRGKTAKLRHDDSRVGEYLRTRGLRTIYPCPSLVQHRDERSLVYTPDEVPFTRKALFYDGDK